MNPFEHVKNLHTKKRRWEDFNDEEKKSFNVFIINKGLSMNPEYLGIVNMVQNFTGLNQILSQKEVFNLYFLLKYFAEVVFPAPAPESQVISSFMLFFNFISWLSRIWCKEEKVY